MIHKIKWVAIACAAIAITAILLAKFNCNRPEQVNPLQQTIDSLKLVIEDKDKEIDKLDYLVTHYAKEYDSTAKVNDSLQDRGVKTVIKYREVRTDTDTAAIIAVCDSMAKEYSEFIFQTKETLKAADSVITAQQGAIEVRSSQITDLKTLVKKLEDKIEEQAKDLERWKKLAKRRGRAIEW